MNSRKSHFHKFIFIILLTVFSVGLQSQSIKGKWFSRLDLPQIHLRLILHIDSTDKGYSASFDSPDQGGFGIPMIEFSFSFPVVKFKQKSAGLSYDGLVNTAFNRIEGVFKQGETNEKMTFGRDSIPPPETSPMSIKEKYKKEELYITMRDGVKLFTSVYSPKDTTQSYPMLMVRTPYNIEPGGKNNFNFYLSLYNRFVKENYIMVFQDVRGKYMSEGEYEDIRPFNPDKKSNKDIDEASDTYDAVDWLVKNIPHNNGRMGVMGISYPGFYSTMAILSAHPAIKAVSPQAPVTAWFIGDDFHHNGAFFMLDCFSFYYSFGRPRPQPTRINPSGFKWPVQDNYAFFLDLGPVSNIKKKYYGDSIKFWNDAMKHPDYDEFWKARDPRQYLKNVQPAVMTVGGWFDAEDLYGTLHTYSAIEKQNPTTISNHLVMGPWAHAQWSSAGTGEKLGNIYWGQDVNKVLHEMEVKFFNYYLKDKGALDFPEALIFVTGANQWRNFDSWPPGNVTEQTLFFQPSGKLSFVSPKEIESFDEYLSDPLRPVPYTEKVHLQRTREYMTDDQRFATRRPDVMVYKTDKLTENITLTGPITADLFVSTTGTDADYVVKLIDVFPEDTTSPADHKIDVPLGGYQMLIRGDILRGRYRNSFEKPEAFIPGKVAEVKFELPDIAHTFKKGHRIMVQVQNSWFPLVDSNPQKFVNIYQCSESDFQKATHRIYHDKKRPSQIKVKVLKDSGK
jgi:putative CocE/NonD family hydrolase